MESWGIKALSHRDRTGIWRKNDPVLVLQMEDLARRMEHSKKGIPQSRGIASDRESQHDAARSSRGLRGGNRIARRERDNETRKSAKDMQQVTLALEASLSSIKNGSEPWNEVTLNRLQCW